MKEDKYGFNYPVINQKKCINCRLCQKECAYNDNDTNKVKESYAAVNQEKDVLKKSTSGGIFGAIAEEFLANGDCVCGAEMIFKNSHATVKHMIIEQKKDLNKLQGSKYVQSNMEDIFKNIKSKLKEGKKVLFSGTPCQVAAIKKCMGNNFKDRLFTIDIICHGVPSLKLFDDYIQQQSTDKKMKIKEFRFRDKKFGWGLEGIILGENNKGKIIQEQISPDNSSYYRFFLDGEIYRDCCYYCPFAQEKRVGDLTIGDYWGVEKYSSEFLRENGGPFVKTEGISCLFVNTVQGQKMLEDFGTSILKEKVEISKVKIINTQLREPAKHTKLRKKLLDGYTKKGYVYIEKIFVRNSKILYVKRIIKEIIKKIIFWDKVKSITNLSIPVIHK